jgi:hypothetical protein
MKKIFSILSIFALMFLINSCRSEELTYEGDSLLLFNSPQSSANTTVTSGAGNATYNVPFGVVKTVDADSDVTLVVDAANSTAKEGVDFIIPNKTVTLKAGTSTGTVPVTLLETGATLAPKSIAFKLQSNTLKNAAFNQNFKLNYSLACPFVNTKFNGNYKVVTDTWADYATNDLVPVKPGANANEIYIMSTNNPYLVNSATSYMILTVSPEGNVVVTSNQNFDYGGGFVVPITGTGTVDRCSGDINLSVLNFGTYKNNKFVLKK